MTGPGGSGRLIGRQTVGDPKAWFWKVVTGDGAIYRFSAAMSPPYPIEVRLLASESIGCFEATDHFHIDKYGNFVAG